MYIMTFMTLMDLFCHLKTNLRISLKSLHSSLTNFGTMEYSEFVGMKIVSYVQILISPRIQILIKISANFSN